jgi:hypothetical protein
MYSTLFVDGVSADFIEDDTTVEVTFAHGDETSRCTTCGEDLTDTVDGLASDADGQTCPDVNDDQDVRAHTPEPVPLSWANSASIRTDDGEDSITVSISVGDPRGAFCFTVRRIPDDADTNLAGRLVLHTPYPAQSMAHRPLAELRPGTYLVG